MCVITIDFLAKLDTLSKDNLRVNIEVHAMKNMHKSSIKIFDQIRFKRATLLLCEV